MPDVLDEHLLGGRSPALHAVEHDRVGAGLDRQCDVVVGAAGADLDVDRDPPVGDLAQLLDLDLEVVGSGPVRVAAGAALVDAGGQVAHLGHAVGDLVAEQHAAAARLGPLADHHLDRVGAAQVVGVHAVARGQQLVDQLGRVLALLGRHAAVAGGGRGADLAGSPPQRLLGVARQRAEAHPGDRDRDVELDRLAGKPGSDGHVGGAALPVALQRIARHAGAQKQQIVEVRHAALGPEAADVIDPRAGGTLDLGDRVPVKDGRLAQSGLPSVGLGVSGHLSRPRRCRP